ncbi:MAG: D-alanyl-D-alanine carboxypeptidase/D-alanyl-D-alanine-endopeptidase [Methylophaga sp.]|nr:D-alanyl-D-alanine carboxypeptidase/D-alanyl-D-alanine-endopeptidase [Methylophaga sp.]
MKLILASLLCFSLLAPAIHAQESLKDQTHPALNGHRLPNGTDVALMVVDANSNQVLYSSYADQVRQPASTQKLVTALAAAIYLKDYRFETRVERNNQDIIFHFTGDPTLTRSQLRVLVERLKSYQDSIEGNVYLNGGVFDTFERAIGVPWDIMGVCYSAPSSALTLNGNCVYGRLEATSEPPITGVRATAPEQVNIRAGDISMRQGLEYLSVDCRLKLIADSQNNYTVGGCLETHRLPVNFHLAIQNPTTFTATILDEELQRAGIRLNGEIIRNDRIKGDEILVVHRSAPMMELIDTMVKDSDNLIADNLLKTIGRFYYDKPGSFENGAAAIKAILRSEAGIDLDSAIIVDGSGLSRNNRMTASQLMQVVQYIFKNPDLGLVSTMPVSGRSGTLRGRPSVSHELLVGKIAAKTGAIYGTYNLAGRIQARSGRHLYFVQIISNYHPADDRNRRQPLRAFERRLYESLYNDY